jgi:ammonia channel protein AmtB
LRELPRGLQSLIWGILGFLIVLSGIASGNIVTVTIGAALAFTGTSAYLTSHVKSESRLKKALEVVYAIIAVAIIIYGYIATRSLLLEFLCFMAVIFLLSFVLSYLLPRVRYKSIRRRPKNNFNC